MSWKGQNPDRPLPRFGKADLGNCEQEQIHLAGSIQPHGALIVVDEASSTIIQASDNARAFLSMNSDLLQAKLHHALPSLPAHLNEVIGQDLSTIPAAFACAIGDPATKFDCLVHRIEAGTLVLEFEVNGRDPSADKFSPASLTDALGRIASASTLSGLSDTAATIFKEFIGYDRTMVYRFDAEGHGEVFAERREEALEPFIGNRYPASDIPQIARRLYERNRVRLLSDVNDTQIPVYPIAVFRDGPRTRHVVVFTAQHVADPCSIPEEHGRLGNPGRVTDGRRKAVGTGIVPPLFCAIP